MQRTEERARYVKLTIGCRDVFLRTEFDPKEISVTSLLDVLDPDSALCLMVTKSDDSQIVSLSADITVEVKETQQLFDLSLTRPMVNSTEWRIRLDSLIELAPANVVYINIVLWSVSIRCELAGFDWKDHLVLSLNCLNSNALPTDAILSFHLNCRRGQSNDIKEVQKVVLNNGSNIVTSCFSTEREELENAFVDKNGKYVIGVRIDLIKGNISRSIYNFTPTDYSSMVLVVEGKRMYVSKEYLATISPFFNALFYSNFKESEQAEIELKDILFEEFHDLLSVLHFREGNVTDRNLHHLLELGDRFQMERVLRKVEKYLMGGKSRIGAPEILILSDKYRLLQAKEKCLSRMETKQQIEEVRNSMDFVHLSEATKTGLLDRALQIMN